MNTFLKQGIFVLVLSVLLVILARKMLVQVRFANLPKPVIAAVESRFPECRKMSVEKNRQTGNYRIGIDNRSSAYLLEIDHRGEVLEITPDPDAETNRPTTASLSRNTAEQEELAVD